MSAQDQTVLDSLPDFARWLAETMTTKPKTQALQIGEMRALCLWHARAYGLPLRFDDLTSETLRLYRAQRRPFDSDSTLNRKRAAWCVFCHWAQMRRLLARNPCARVPRLKKLCL